MTSGRRNKRQRGFTLTELVIVMGVFGLITGGIWAASTGARESQKANDATTELQNVTQNISSLMSGQKFSAPFYPAAASNQTTSMITAQTIPTNYVNTAATANNPWSKGNFYVWSLTAKTYRLSFYQVGSFKSCEAMLLQATSCQVKQVGCPTQVGTGGTSALVAPTSTATPSATLGWQSVTVGVVAVTMQQAANTLCAVNSYAGGANSVEFDYAF